MRRKAEGLLMAVVVGIRGMTIQDGIHRAGEGLVIVLPAVGRNLLTEGVRIRREAGQIHPVEVIPTRRPVETGAVHLIKTIPALRVEAGPGHPRTGAIPILQAGDVLPAIPAKSVMPAGSLPAAAAGRAMPAIHPAVAGAIPAKDNLFIYLIY